MRDLNVDTPTNNHRRIVDNDRSAGASYQARVGADEDDVITIAVMGATGSGKTSFINLASGSNLRVGLGLRSCTNIVQVTQPFELDGRRVVLIDTPGFDDTTKSDADVLRMIAAFLATTYENGKRLSGVLYLHRISDFRMGGISTRNFKMFRELCGEDTLKNVVILTNMWGEVSKEVGEAREFELATSDTFFKPVLDKQAKMLRHTRTAESAHDILRYLINNHPLSLRIQRELVDDKMDISETAAGTELNKELMEQAKKHRQELKQLEKEMIEAIRTKDEETRKELEIERQKLQTEMSRVQDQSQKLASDYNEEKAKLEQRLNELTEKARIEHEKTQAEYEAQLRALRQQLEQSVTSSTAEKNRIMEEISALQRGRGGGMGGLFSMIGTALDALFGMR